GITRHKIQDHWRRVRGLENALKGYADQREHRIRTPAPDLRVAVEEALAALSRDQRLVVDLIYVGGLTFAETARALRIPVGTVKSRVHAALSTLRVFLTRPSAL
ncbi:MAG TPA: RNA polymerase sigma factor, partial [Candidatus Methylomirabilis sp.]|nr:RNA polymerase sigma factor [Candidatus Methylomirabilis sp.]